MGSQAHTSTITLPEALELCLASIEEVKTAYSEAARLQTKLVELEKVATHKNTVDADLVKQTVRNLVASAYVEPAYAEKLATELQDNPTAALHLIQRFIENSTPPFSEGQGVAKLASGDATTNDPDGWFNVVSRGA